MSALRSSYANTAAFYLQFPKCLLLKPPTVAENFAYLTVGRSAELTSRSGAKKVPAASVGKTRGPYTPVGPIYIFGLVPLLLFLLLLRQLETTHKELAELSARQAPTSLSAFGFLRAGGKNGERGRGRVLRSNFARTQTTTGQLSRFRERDIRLLKKPYFVALKCRASLQN